jgi:hypothetical protein
MAIRTRTILREIIGPPTEAAILELSRTALQDETKPECVDLEKLELSKTVGDSGRHETLTKLF